MKYLNHLTLNTGHTRRSYRIEVAQIAIDQTREMLADAIEMGEPVAMPVPDYMLTVEPFGSRRAMLATVARDYVPLLTLGVARRPSLPLWRDLMASYRQFWPDLPTTFDPDTQPAEPWGAALLLPALGFDPDAQRWLGDFERVAAWAWIEP